MNEAVPKRLAECGPVEFPRPYLRVVEPRPKVIAPHYLFAKAAAGSGIFGLTVLAVIESVTGWTPVLVALIPLLSAVLGFLGSLVAIRYQRKKDEKDDDRADALSLVEREKLADGRISVLITEMERFHAERTKQLESAVNLNREMFEQEKAVCQQQRELITQQARTIQDLQRQKEHRRP